VAILEIEGITFNDCIKHLSSTQCNVLQVKEKIIPRMLLKNKNFQLLKTLIKKKNPSYGERQGSVGRRSPRTKTGMLSPGNSGSTSLNSSSTKLSKIKVGCSMELPSHTKDKVLPEVACSMELPSHNKDKVIPEVVSSSVLSSRNKYKVISEFVDNSSSKTILSNSKYTSLEAKDNTSANVIAIINANASQPNKEQLAIKDELLELLMEIHDDVHLLVSELPSDSKNDDILSSNLFQLALRKKVLFLFLTYQSVIYLNKVTKNVYIGRSRNNLISDEMESFALLKYVDFGKLQVNSCTLQIRINSIIILILLKIIPKVLATVRIYI